MTTGSVTNMVANVVSGMPGAASKTNAAGAETSIAPDAFLQALAGLFGNAATPATTVAVAPAATASAATASHEASADDAEDTAAVDPNLLMSLPSWLANAEAPVVPANATPVLTTPTGSGAARATENIAVTNAAQAQQPLTPPPLAAPQPPDTAELAEQASVLPEAADVEGLPIQEASPAPAQPAPTRSASVANSKTMNRDWASLLSASTQAVDTSELESVKQPDLPQTIAPAAASAENAAEPVDLASFAPRSEADEAQPSASAASGKLDLEFAWTSADAGQKTASSTSAPADSSLSTTAMTSPAARGAAEVDATSTTDTTATGSLQERVGTSQWRDELGTKLSWMVDNGKHTASLKLTPEHLGPMEVRIDLDKDQASVWFSATHSETRAALEQALPRLREMMESQGMSLTDAGVFREPPREQPRTANHTGAQLTQEVFEEPAAPATATRTGLLDTYA